MAGYDLRRIIESVGLDGREALLYLMGLSLGNAPASRYATEARLNRITAYNTLERLVRRGLFAIEQTPRGKCYAPASPEELALEARKNADAIDRILPELRALRGPAHRKPHVKFFEGWEGVQRVYRDTLTAEGELLNFANSAIVRSYWERYDEEYVGERVKRDIHLRGIAPDDEAGRRVKGMDSKSLREIRLVGADDFDFNNEINIYGSKVAIASFGRRLDDLFGIIIESPEVAETQRQIFEMAWRYAGMTGMTNDAETNVRSVQPVLRSDGRMVKARP